MADLNKSESRWNPYSIYLVSFAWPRRPGAIERFHAARQPRPRPRKVEPVIEYCQSARDGECIDQHCPQLLDNEPERTGRSCPLPQYPAAE